MTLAELQACCEERRLPLDKMRFALDVDKGHEPRWFYIYLDDMSGEWVVTKNKSDGSRVERYRGYDEETAVQIFADKMEEEANKRGLTLGLPIHQEEGSAEQDIQEDYEEAEEPGASLGWVRKNLSIAIILIVAALVGVVWIFTMHAPTRGQGFDKRPDYDSKWEQIDLPRLPVWEFIPHYDYSYDYDYGYDYDYDYSYDDDWSYDWDSGDTDWDSGWDSGDTTWDSDWDSGDTDWDSDW